MLILCVGPLVAAHKNASQKSPKIHRLEPFFRELLHSPISGSGLIFSVGAQQFSGII